MGRPKGSKNVIQRRNTHQIVNNNKYASLHVRDRDGNIKGTFLIDIEDLPRSQEYCWSFAKSGYPIARTKQGRSKSKTFYLHRFLMNAKKGQQIDHINNLRNDNRKENLRFSTQSENMHNVGVPIDNSSGIKGVSKIRHHKRKSSWHAYIEINGKRINKMCATFEEAVAQRKVWEREFKPDGL